MKKLLLTAVFVGINGRLAAQEKTAREVDSFSYSSLYAGINSITSFSTDSVGSQSLVNLRAGMKARMNVYQWLVIKAWGAIHVDKNEPIAGYNSFELLIKPADRITFHTGLIATPTTVLRPNPTTWESHTETKTQGTIIPGRIGTKLTFKMDEHSAIAYGIFHQSNHWAHHINLTFRHWQIAAYKSKNETLFMAFKYKSDIIENTTTYRNQEQISNVLFINFKDHLMLVIDGQFQIPSDDVIYWQTGFRRFFNNSSVGLKGFFGIVYDWQDGFVKGQVLLYLSQSYP